MAKQIMLDIVPIWRDRGINSALVGVDGSHLWRRMVDSDEI